MSASSEPINPNAARQSPPSPSQQASARMTNTYSYDLRDCQVVDKTALHSFREKRTQWSNWLDNDPDHAIWDVVIGLVWRDTTFATISRLALENPEGPLNTTLLAETIVTGHVATQVLALRRLTDRGSNVISLH